MGGSSKSLTEEMQSILCNQYSNILFNYLPLEKMEAEMSDMWFDITMFIDECIYHDRN